MGRNLEFFQSLARKITGDDSLTCRTKKDALKCITGSEDGNILDAMEKVCESIGGGGSSGGGESSGDKLLFCHYSRKNIFVIYTDKAATSLYVRTGDFEGDIYPVDTDGTSGHLFITDQDLTTCNDYNCILSYADGSSGKDITRTGTYITI